MNTGAWGSVTCHKELTMDYRKYTASFPCPVRLTGAITKDNGVSQYFVFLGEGYVLVPCCFPQHSYVQVKVYYSPHLTGTIVNEEDMMRDTKKDREDFSGLILHKYYCTEDDDIDTLEIQVQHQSNDFNRDNLITGIQNEFGKCYIQPVLFLGMIRCNSSLATVNADVGTMTLL